MYLSTYFIIDSVAYIEFFYHDRICMAYQPSSPSSNESSILSNVPSSSRPIMKRKVLRHINGVGKVFNEISDTSLLSDDMSFSSEAMHRISASAGKHII